VPAAQPRCRESTIAPARCGSSHTGRHGLGGPIVLRQPAARASRLCLHCPHLSENRHRELAVYRRAPVVDTVWSDSPAGSPATLVRIDPRTLRGTSLAPNTTPIGALRRESRYRPGLPDPSTAARQPRLPRLGQLRPDGAAIAVNNGEAVRERIRSIVAENVPTLEAFFVRWSADRPSDVPRPQTRCSPGPPSLRSTRAQTPKHIAQSGRNR
jgi:hypothetical protein